MSKTKNILLASTIGLMGVSLFACSNKNTRNTQIPYDSITNTVVASAGDFSITQQELYDQLKYKNGYKVFNDTLDRMLFSQYVDQVKYEGDVKIEVDKEIATAVYGTSELPKLKLMEEKELVLARKKFVDNMKRNGLNVTEDELKFEPITKLTENVSFNNLSETTKKHYMFPQAKKQAGKQYIENVCDKEYIEKADGKFVKNNYYINDKRIESQYESNYRHHNTATGIILRFNNAHDANQAIIEAGLTSNNLLEGYVKLFNNYYNYRDTKLSVDKIGVDEDTIFKTNDELAQLDEFSPNVTKLFIEEMKNGEGLLKPMNIDNKYYLIYRSDVEYKTGLDKDLTFAQLKQELPTEFEKITKQLKDDIIDSQASSVSSLIYSQELEKSELKIYDPYIENTFAGSNTFYEYVTDCDNKYIFTSKEGNLTTKDFYNELLNYQVEATVVDLILDKYLYKNESSRITEDEKKKISDELNAELKEFNKGKKNLNKDYGETNYLFFQYGYTTKNAVLESKYADIIKTNYINDFVSNNWSTDDHKFNAANLGILENIMNTALEVFKEKKGKVFDINLDHILISIDNDQDGNPDNMLEFLDKLSKTEKKEFEQAITELSKAIAKEVEAIKRDNTKEKLDYVVYAFNNNLPTSDGKNWSDYKTYHFALKAESLGNIDEGSVNNFVKEFKEYVIELFDKAVKEDLKIETSKEKDGQLYFPNRTNTDGTEVKVDKTNFEAQDLCTTQFGYHMISLNSYKKDDQTLRFKFTKEQDPSGDYQNIKIILDEKDKDNKDDDIYIITDIYNDNNDKPSINQVLVYYVEKTNGEVTSIKTSIKNNLSALLDDVIAKYKSAGFQEYILLKKVGTITTTNIPNFNYDTYLEYLKNSNESYDEESYYFNHWYNDDYTWNK